MVTPPADANVNPLLKGPWTSAHPAGIESVVVPAAGLAAGEYTVTLTASQPNTTFSLQARLCVS